MKVRCIGWLKVSLAMSCLLLLGVSPLRAVNWLPFGPDGGDARRIAPDPKDPTHLYLGTTNGWIYESHNTGASWHRLARVDKRDDLVLDAIVVDSTNSRHLIVGAHNVDRVDGGMFISYDAGKTWINQAEMRGQSVRALQQSVSNPNELVAGTLKGVYRSLDAGQRWSLISPRDSTELHNFVSVAIDPNDPDVIYAGTWHLPWKTTDGGQNWENIKEGIIEDSDVFSIIVDPVTPKIVYASACSGIYKSEDSGTLFHKVQGIPSSARRTRVLMQDPNDLNVVFAGTTEGLFRSDDAGKTWTRTTGPEIIVNDVEVDKADSKHVLIATDRGGVLASEDGGDTFHPSNGGFSARQIAAIKRDENNPAVVLVGIVNDKEWGGVFRSRDGGLSWVQCSEGLQGLDVFALGQAPDGTFVAGTSHGIFRLDPASQTWIRVGDAPGATDVTNGLRPPAVTLERAAAERPALIAHPSAHSSVRRPVVTKNMTLAQRRAALLTARRRSGAPRKPVSPHRAVKRSTGGSHAAARSRPSHPAPGPVAAISTPTAIQPSGAAPPAGDAAGALPTEVAAPAAAGKGFDGAVYYLATSGPTMLAATSAGLLTSSDDGLTWTLAGPENSVDWRFLAAAKDNVIAASLHNLSFSADEGKTWAPVLLPEGLTQVGAVAVEPSGEVWVGGREGVFVSHDAGNTWTTPKNLFVNSVNSIFYDEAGNRIMVTTGGYSSIVFLVHLPDMKVSFADSGWNLRFARPMGDHLIAATLFDGIVVQPRMIASPMEPAAAQGLNPARPVNSINPPPPSQ